MSTYTTYEIELPPNYYSSTIATFAEAFSISPNGRYMSGTFGDRGGPGHAIDGKFGGFLSFRHPFAEVTEIAPFRYRAAVSARGINDFGTVVGFYRDDRPERLNQIHGYLRRHVDAWVGPVGPAPEPRDLDLPGATYPTSDEDPAQAHNAAYGINNDGFVVGIFRPEEDLIDRGFVWSPHLNRTRTVDLSQVARESVVSAARGINSHGDFVGSFIRADSQSHGYKWKVNTDANQRLPLIGDPVLIDVILPGGVPAVSTTVSGINDHGVIVGSYDVSTPERSDRQTTTHGFAWRPNPSGNYVHGAHVTVDVEGASDTILNGISNDGTFVGYYRAPSKHFDSKPIRHAFWGHFIAVVTQPPLIAPIYEAIFQMISASIAAGGSGWVFPWGGVPGPWPPPTPTFTGAVGQIHDAMAGLVIYQLASQIADVDGRQLLQHKALEVVLREVRRLLRH